MTITTNNNKDHENKSWRFQFCYTYLSDWSRTQSNSKHWFTTSFLQPLPLFITPHVKKTVSSWTVFRWCSNGSMFVTLTDKLYQAFLLSYASTNRTKNHSNQDRTLLLPATDASHVYVHAWKLSCFQPYSRQLRGDKRVPLQWHNQFWQSLEEGIKMWCLECGSSFKAHLSHTCWPCSWCLRRSQTQNNSAEGHMFMAFKRWFSVH